MFRKDGDILELLYRSVPQLSGQFFVWISLFHTDLKRKKFPVGKWRFLGWWEVLGLGGDFKDVFANFTP